MSIAFAMSYTVSAATETAMSASISTPVWAVVSADGLDLDRAVDDGEPDVDVRQRKRVAERDELGRALRGHDPGELRRRRAHRPSAAP